jgi:hypothetical protein
MDMIQGITKVKFQNRQLENYGVITIDGLKPFHGPWTTFFAWKPVQYNGGGWAWLCRVAVREISVPTPDHVSHTVLIEYRRVGDVVKEKMLGNV